MVKKNEVTSTSLEKKDFLLGLGGEMVRFIWLGFVLGSIFVLNTLDGILTIFWVETGRAEEANPLMEHVLSASPGLFMILKLSLVALGLTLLWRLRKNRFSFFSSHLILACYSGIIFYHFYGLQLFFL
jgi:uncharacterized membrane protein